MKVKPASSPQQRPPPNARDGFKPVAVVAVFELVTLFVAGCGTVLQPPSLPSPPTDQALWTEAYRYAVEQLFEVPTNTIVFIRDAEAGERRDLQHLLPAYEIAPCSEGEMDSGAGVRRQDDHRPGLWLSVTHVKQTGGATELTVMLQEKGARFGTVSLVKPSEGDTRWQVASAALEGIADPEPPPRPFTVPLDKWVKPPAPKTEKPITAVPQDR